MVTTTIEKKEETVSEKTAEQKVTRKKRVPFGVAKTKLGIEQNVEGYHLHWINDTVGRIYDAEQGGYEFVAPHEVGLSDTDNRVKRRVGVNDDGTALFAFLMKIRQDWYEEDEKERQSRVDAIDNLIKGGHVDGARNTYIPSSGINMQHK